MLYIIWPLDRDDWYRNYLLMLSKTFWQQYTCMTFSKYPQTLNWIFSHKTYAAWLDYSDSCVLYIHGQCGIGKTNLSSFLWKSLHATGQAGEGDVITTLYFSFHHEDKRQSSIRSLLSSIIYQLLTCQPKTFLSVRIHFDWPQRSWLLTVEELWIIFRSLVSILNYQRFICIIDAIDQCNVPFDATLQDFLAISVSREANFKVIATSRMSPESLHHQQLFSINLDSQKEIDMDIQASIKMHLHDLLQANEAFLEFDDYIVEELQKAGTHLEVVLAFEHLKNPTFRLTPRSMRNTLQSLHCSPSDVCDRIINQFTELPPWARTALCWIVLAIRPLTCHELSVAVAIGETTSSYSEMENDVPRNIAQDMKQLLGGILSANHDEIRFIHLSIKETLLAHLNSSNPSRLSLDLSHFDLARRCLAYLSFAEFENNMLSKPVKASSQEYSPPGNSDLLDYAVEFWPEHYRRAEGKEQLKDVALRFMRNGKHLERWSQHRPYGRPRQGWVSRPVSALQFAAGLGLADIVTMLISQDGGNNTTFNDKEAALDTAAENGHLEVAIQLINDGATSDRALSLAARHGNLGLVQQLIRESDMKGIKTDGAPKVDVTSDTDEASDTDRFSPLCIAALRGHTAVIGALLEAGVSPGSVNTSGDTPFSLAVKGGQLAALKQLLCAHDSVVLADKTEFSLLHLAARRGHLEIVRELIRIGADPNAVGKDRSTPLLLAAEGGHLVLVKELINGFRADLGATNDAGFCAVHVAAANGHVRVIEQLCKHEPDLDAKDKRGSQPIHLAAEGGHLEITKILLGKGVDSSTIEGRGLTPLHLATRGGHLGVVQVLLKDPKSIIRSISGLESQGRVGTGGLNNSAENESKDYGTLEENDDASTSSSSESYDSDEDLAKMNEARSDESDDEPFSPYEDRSNPSKSQSENEATPMHSAAKRGYVEIVRELLKADHEYNIRSKQSLTPLHLAAKEGYVSVVKELLQRNADPNVADVNKSSPLHAASIAGNLAMVKALVGFGADVNKSDDSQVSPLHHAAKRGHIDIVRHLLEAGAEFGAINASGQTPLHIAVSQRYFDVVAALLPKNANPDTRGKHGWTALHFAVSGKNIETRIINQLLQSNADVHASNDGGSTALFLAAESGSEAAVKTLLDAGGEANAKNTANSTPMHRAAQGGHLAVVKLLMEAGANPLAKKRHGITPLHLALENGHFDVAAELLEPVKSELPSIDDYEESLCSLAPAGFEEGIKKALKYPLRNLERGDPRFNQSPLSHAAEHGHERVVQMLLDEGAEPNSVDRRKRTPLMWAVLNEHRAVAEKLLERGADVHESDHAEWTALHFAVRNRSTPVANLLLDMGADVSATIKGGFTTLHLAVFYEAPALIRLLVRKGASMSSRNSSETTPLEYAVRYKDVFIVELLLDLGASFSTPFPPAWTAIHEAIGREDESLIRLLVRRCSDAFVGQHGWTRLHLAALSGDSSSVREQLEQGIDRNAKDRNGLTPLHWAAARSHENVVKLLLQMDAEIHAKDNQGMTALHYAALKDNEGTVRALLEKGAERNIVDLHGWTPVQIAQMYAYENTRDTLSDDNETTVMPGTRLGLAPSRWVKAISSSDITISEDGQTVIAGKKSCYQLLATLGSAELTTDNVDRHKFDAKLEIRADHPMPAGGYVFYFEVIFVDAGSTKYILPIV